MNIENSTHVHQRSLEAEISGLLDLGSKLNSLGILKAVTQRGEHYARDAESDVTVVAREDRLLKLTKNTMTVVMARPGASRDDVIADMGSFTQELRGAMVGRSQSWVSENTKD